MRRRFEYAEDDSRKFWQIELDEGDNEVTVRFGRLGTNGATKRTEHGTPGAAAKDAAKLIAQKCKKGYVEVEPLAPMLELARRAQALASDPRADSIALSKGTLAIGDPITDSGLPIPVGVDRVRVAIDEIEARRAWGEDDNDDEDDDDDERGQEDRLVVIVGVRPTVVLSWEAAETGGVDAGVFGVWDAARPPAEGDPGECDAGLDEILGRPVMAIPTGDGWFPGVLGRDVDGAIAAIVAGPGVDPKRFGVRSAAEREAKAARLAAASASVLGADGCALVSALVAGLDDRARAAASANKKAFTAPGDAKKAAKQRQLRLELVLAWGLRRWHAILSTLMPAETAVLPAAQPSLKKGAPAWDKPARDVLDYEMSTRAFDLEQEILRAGGKSAVEAVKAAVTPADLEAVGVRAFEELVRRLDLHRDVVPLVTLVREGLFRALLLVAFSHADAPRAAVEAAVARGVASESAEALLARLAPIKG